MDASALLMTVLSALAVRLPVVIALSIGLVWVLGAPRDGVRTGALVGLVLLLVTSLLGLLLNLLPMWMLSQGDYGSMSQISTYLGIGHFALGLLEAFGMVMLVWALVRLLKQQLASGQAPLR